MQNKTSNMLLVLTLWAWTSNAYAYLDPNSGSILLQLILGGVAGAMVAGKLFWHRILMFFSFAKKPDSGDDAAEGTEDSSSD